MKLKKGTEVRTIYFDEQYMQHPREEVLGQVQGKSISEGKEIVKRYKKKQAQSWVDREGNIRAWTYSPHVLEVEIKPADAEARRADYLKQLREALDKISKPGATTEDIAAALRLQIEYEEFKSLLDD